MYENWVKGVFRRGNENRNAGTRELSFECIFLLDKTAKRRGN